MKTKEEVLKESFESIFKYPIDELGQNLIMKDGTPRVIMKFGKKAIDLTLAERNKELSKEINGCLRVTQIQNNMQKSFKGTINDALKNNYQKNKHYVIVDWEFFHELLDKEEELKQRIGIK